MSVSKPEFRAVRTSRERGVSEALLARRGWGSSHVAHAHHCSVRINSRASRVNLRTVATTSLR